MFLNFCGNPVKINFNLVIQCCTICFYSKKIEENGGKKTQFDLSNSLSPEVFLQSLYSLSRFSSTSSHTFLGSAVVECLSRDRGVAGSSFTGVTELCP